MKKLPFLIALAALAAACAALPAKPALAPVAERWKAAAKGMEAPLVLKLPGMDAVKTASVEYEAGRSMDLYYPGDWNSKTALPVVVFAMGYSTEFTTAWFGAKLKDIGQYISWGQLVAASGMVGVAYETDYPDDDLDAVLGFIMKSGASLGMDPRRIAIYACSGNAMTGLGALASKVAPYRASLKCGVVMYPIISYFMNKGDDVMPAPFKRELRGDLPIFMATIGQERPEWKEGVAAFLAKVQGKGYPLEVAYFEKGTHGFDTDLDSDESRALISHALAFMKEKLGK